jgi:D-threonate/D-erythronate kinase
MSGKLIIVADDFTGANDTGVQFRKPGYIVNVIISSERLKEEVSKCDVLSVDLESRIDSPQIAFEKAKTAGRQIREAGEVIVYKKLDSAFRGNVGAELDGLLEGMNARVVFLAPAFPSFGRTTENGTVYINNIELAKTEYSNDPRNPVSESLIEEIIQSQCQRKCCHVTVNDLINIPDGDFTWITEKAKEGFEIFIFDSKTESDLATIARKIENFSDLPFLFAGSAGLAGHLNLNYIFHQNPVSFAFSGSVTETTMKQISYCENENNCIVIHLNAFDLLDNKLSPDKLASIIEDSLKSGTKRFIFCTARTRKDVDAVFSEAGKRSLSRSAVARIITDSFGKLAARLISGFNPAGIILTGGETAFSVFTCLKATGLTIETEILPGLQCGKLRGCDIKSLIATKSGGFGSIDAISKTFEFFKV